jgi:CelD/BcsL family acetyltransferase involved in cellulose biosynthesis
MSGACTRWLEPEEWYRWDALVSEHPHGTLFQSSSWLSRLPGTLSVLVWEEEGRLLGGVPILRNRRFRMEGVHPPALTPYMGPLIMSPTDGEKAHARRSVYQQGVQVLLGALPPVGHLDFLLHPGQTNLLPYLWNGFSVDVGYTNVLEGSYEDFLSQMSYGHRKKLRRLQRMQEAGHIQMVELDNPLELMPLLEATMRTKFFRYDVDAIARLFTLDNHRKSWQAVKAVADGKALACALCAFDTRSYYSLVGGVSREGNSDLSNAHLLCFDHMIRLALESSRRFDFCGSSLPGVDHFNRRYGGELQPRLRVLKSRSLMMSLLRVGKMIRHERKPWTVVD